MKYVFLYRVNRNNMKLRKYYPTIVLSDIHLFGMVISHYLNSGDWVESLTAFVENEQGE